MKVLLFFVTLSQSVQLSKWFLLFEFQCSLVSTQYMNSTALHRKSYILLLHNHPSTFFSSIQNIRVTINNTALDIWEQINRRLLLVQCRPAAISIFFDEFSFQEKGFLWRNEFLWHTPNIFSLNSIFFFHLLRHDIHLFSSAFMGNNDWNELHSKFLASEVTVDIGTAVRVATILDWYELICTSKRALTFSSVLLYSLR